MHGALIRYRVMTYIVGSALIVLVFVGVPLQVWAHFPMVANVEGTIHGYLYLVYLIAAADLARRAHWRLGRILAVADACDAMMSTRRYRAALSAAQIDDVLLAGAATQWDPSVVASFMRCRQAVYSGIYQRGTGDSAQYAIAQLVEALKEGSSATHRLANPEPPAAAR